MLKSTIIKYLMRRGFLSKPLAEAIYEGQNKRSALTEGALDFKQDEINNIAKDIQEKLLNLI